MFCADSASKLWFYCGCLAHQNLLSACMVEMICFVEQVIVPTESLVTLVAVVSLWEVNDTPCQWTSFHLPAGKTSGEDQLRFPFIWVTGSHQRIYTLLYIDLANSYTTNPRYSYGWRLLSFVCHIDVVRQALERNSPSQSQNLKSFSFTRP